MSLLGWLTSLPQYHYAVRHAANSSEVVALWLGVRADTADAVRGYAHAWLAAQVGSPISADGGNGESERACARAAAAAFPSLWQGLAAQGWSTERVFFADDAYRLRMAAAP
jgi:hypothetical protein